MLFRVQFDDNNVSFLAGDDLSTINNHPCEMRELPVAGLNSILSKEHGKNFYNLPIIKYSEKDVCAVAAWDSSVHDSVHLNKVTDSKCWKMGVYG